MPPYTLYVAQDRKHPSRLDVGSVLCLQMIETLDDVTVAHVRKDDPHPTWLVGTPTLFDDPTGEIWRGHQAVTHLHHLALSRAAAPSVATAPSAPAASRKSRSAPHTGAAPGAPADGGSPPPPPPPLSPQDTDPMWESVVPEDGYADDEPQDGPESLTKKLTSDDFARAMQVRTQSLPPQRPPDSNNQKRPPPSMSD